MTDGDAVRIGISSCLIGEEVRFDGGHKHDRYITGTLGMHFEYVPVCPEVEIGLGTPRESIRLVGDADSTRLVGGKSGMDITARMEDFARERIGRLRESCLDGYIFKSKSPTCGMERVRVYPDSGDGAPSKNGRGVFARQLMEAMPFLPVEEEGRLNDPGLRERFVVTVFCHHRWRRLISRKYGLGDLMAFHARHKFLLMARSDPHLRRLGRLLGSADPGDIDEVTQDYAREFFAAMSQPAGRGEHVNVLQHIVGYLREHLDAADRQGLHDSIESYREGLVPLIVPITLIRHFVAKHDVEYIAGQVFLEPHPRELLLLNHP